MIVQPSFKKRAHQRAKCPRHRTTLIKFHGPFGPYWACPFRPQGCDIVGNYSPHDRQFRLSNQELRDARKRAHAAFDLIWIEGHMTRSAAYEWLACQLGIKNGARDCHFKHFDLALCERVRCLSKGLLNGPDVNKML